MCFHSKQTKKAIELEKRFNALIESMDLFAEIENYNGFAHPKTPVITNQKPEIIQHYNWGLIPAWANDDEIKKFTLNAKIETLHEKPAFKNSVNKRCLIIADGFYEWQWLTKNGNSKQKYLISLPDEKLFAFAGIWSAWINPVTNQTVNTYSIVTTAANKLMEEIHNSKKRMPVILEPFQEIDWLTGTDVNEFKNCNVELVATKI